MVSANAKRAAYNITTNHWNRDSDEWLSYRNKKGVAAIISIKTPPQAAVSLHHKQTCRRMDDIQNYFTTIPDTQSDDHPISLDSVFETNEVDVALITRQELFQPHTDSAIYQSINQQTLKTLTDCLATQITINSTTPSQTVNQRFTMIHPAPLVLNDDRKRSQYQSDTSILSGRVPFSAQNFSLSQCASSPSHSPLDLSNPIYRHWFHTKNMWFYSIRPHCNASGNGQQCLIIDNQSFIAVVSFGGSSSPNQDRISERLGGSRQAFQNYLDPALQSHFFETIVSTLSTQSAASHLPSLCLSESLNIVSCGI